MKPLVMMLRQDDPAKCTAAKLAKFGIATAVRLPDRDSIVLDPFSKIAITKSDKRIAKSICAVDCSWERADAALQSRAASRGIRRRLPALLAANPVNYAKLGKLSTAEAIAGGLYVVGEIDVAHLVMNKFKWGHTFLELNADPLAEYASAESQQQIRDIEGSYFSAAVDPDSFQRRRN